MRPGVRIIMQCVQKSGQKNIHQKKSFNIESKKTDWDNVAKNLDENFSKFLKEKFVKST